MSKKELWTSQSNTILCRC